MQRRKIFLLVVTLLIAVCGAVAFAYEREHTPEYALEQIARGIEDRDYGTVARYADIPAIISASYDESTAILCQDIERLNRMYPQDWFFHHDTAFMTGYIAERRQDDLIFIERTIELYLSPEITPVSRRDGEARWIADETKKFLEEYDAQVLKVETDGEGAVATIAIKGHDSTYGRLAPKLTLKVGMEEQADGCWKVVRVSNVREMFYPVVDGIENYWTMQGWQ